MFEISDVVKIDRNQFTGARNQRKLCFAHVSNTSSFEGIHGVIDTLMTLFGLKHEKDYYLTASENVSFFPGRQANLIVRGKNCGVKIYIYLDIWNHCTSSIGKFQNKKSSHFGRN